MNSFALTHPDPAHDDYGLAFWPTPRWVIGALLDACPPPTEWVLEPSAGTGVIAAELKARGYKVLAVEVREECREQLEDICDDVLIVDFTTFSTERWFGDHPFSIVGNTPWNPMIKCVQHVRHTLPQVFNAGVHTSLLLPLRFLSGGKEKEAAMMRRKLHLKYPVTRLFPLAERPRFAGAGGKDECAWFNWEPGADREIRMLERNPKYDN